ncbi:MAG: hypothetical protein ABJA86_11715 [Nocardioidaceae bacterium]
MDKVEGLAGQLTIDATNMYESYPAGFDSLASQVKSLVGGPTAKAFNTNFAALYDDVDAEPVRPGTMFVCDFDARTVTEQLIEDAGFDPIYLGGLDQARGLENLVAMTQMASRGGLGPFFYPFQPPW